MRRPLLVVMILALIAAASGCGGSPRLHPGTGFVSVPGGRVWYEIVGDGPGTPLLVLHGGPGVPHDYLKPLGALGKDRPVVFYDQLGCGHSDQPHDSTLWTLPRFVQELAAVRRELHLDQVDLLGHSWGTVLAFEYLRTQPQGVRALVLSGPALSIPMWEHDADSLRRLLPDSTQRKITRHEQDGSFDSPEYQSAMNDFYRLHLAQKPWSADLDSSMNRIAIPVYGYMEGPSEFTITGTLKGYDATSHLHEIAVPTLVTAGQDDEAVPGTAKYFASLIPGAELVVIEASGHIVTNDNPDRYNQVVRVFLARHDAPR